MVLAESLPHRICLTLWSRRALLAQLVWRDVLLRYRGALFGVLWVFLSPLLLLAIFAFVFGHVFQARWPQQAGGLPYWVLLYAGLIAFNVFSETVSRAPGAVRGYPSYVKKIVFPLEILPVVPLGTALMHAAFNGVVLALILAGMGKPVAGLLLYPLLLLPLVLSAMGIAWFVSAWGVFIKDMTQVVPLFVQMVLFLSPVFYPMQAVPAVLQPWYRLNPLGPVIEACRCAIAEAPVDWVGWSGVLGFSLLVLVLGYAFFRHSREEFADVL